MSQKRVTVLWILALVLMPTCGLAEDKPIRVSDVPREFEGEFVWKDTNTTFTVVLKIDKIEKKGGMIRFTGTDVYTPGDVKMKVEGTIDPKKRSVSMRESEPSSPDAVTDGSFEGTISEDHQSIEVEWTTKGTGQKGSLKIKAKSII